MTRFVHTPYKKRLRFVAKPPKSDAWKAIQRAAARHHNAVRDGFMTAVRSTRRAFDMDGITDALLRYAADIAVDRMPWAHFERKLESELMPAMREAYTDAGEATARHLGKIKDHPVAITKQHEPAPAPGTPGGAEVAVGIAFDLRNPRTELWIARHAAQLVTMLRDESRKAIRAIVLEAQTRGLDIRQQAERIAKVLRRDFGLNAQQARALTNYEAQLIADGLARRIVDRQVAERRERMIVQRSRMIARQETLAAARQGQLEIWQQASESGLLLPFEQEAMWITQLPINERNPCPICRPMDRQRRRFGEPFVSPYDGRVIPHGQGAHIGCECVVVLAFEEDD